MLRKIPAVSLTGHLSRDPFLDTLVFQPFVAILVTISRCVHTIPTDRELREWARVRTTDSQSTPFTIAHRKILPDSALPAEVD